VVPSLYEGFCLPMLEAMACGVPTIVANASCLPEISGNSLLYFNPLEAGDMAEKMLNVIDNEDLRGRLASAGRKRAAEFSWRRCARETLDVLLEVAACRNGARNRAASNRA